LAAWEALAEDHTTLAPASIRTGLLDPAGSVRGLAQFIVRTRWLPIVPRDVYCDALQRERSRRQVAAIDGLGETGDTGDVARLNPFLEAQSPRVRRSALRAIARLDPERGQTAAMTALGDPAPSVQSAAVHVLGSQANRVDFAAVSARMSATADGRGRLNLLRLLALAPKWDAVAYCIESINDVDEKVRRRAWQLLDSWLAGFNRTQTPPTALQRHRLEEVLQGPSPQLPARTVDLLRFLMKSC
jgi:HEAT repeat protein